MEKSTDRQFEFINATTPGSHLAHEARRRVRTHVMNEHVRDKKRKTSAPNRSRNSSSGPTVPRSSSPSESLHKSNPGTASLPRMASLDTPIGYPSALTIAEYPVEMLPQTHVLLSTFLNYVSRKVFHVNGQLNFNPFGTPEWFKFAVTDEATLHAFLYAGAIYTALLQGKRESEDIVYHQGRTISIINKRLSVGDPIDDSTIGALSCIALGEALTGNLDVWRIHMRGLNSMIQTRGSIFSLTNVLQTKLRRSDITGAIDYAATPYLDFHRPPQPTWSTLPQETLDMTQRDITTLLTACEIHPNLITIMREVAYFTQAIQSAKSGPTTPFDPVAFLQDMYWLEYSLLLFPKALPQTTTENAIDKACRLGALVYLKAIIEEFPHSATGSSVLLTQLRDSLSQIPIDVECVPLLLWLSSVGATLSKPGAIKEWFAGNFRSCVASAPDENISMSTVLPLQDFFGGSLGHD